MERLADAAADRAHTRFIVTDDPQEAAARVAEYVELGFQELVFHFPGRITDRAMTQFASDVMPLLRSDGHDRARPHVLQSWIREDDGR